MVNLGNQRVNSNLGRMNEIRNSGMIFGLNMPKLTSKPLAEQSWATLPACRAACAFDTTGRVSFMLPERKIRFAPRFAFAAILNLPSTEDFWQSS